MTEETPFIKSNIRFKSCPSSRQREIFY